MRLKFEPDEFDFLLVGPEPEENLEELDSGEIGLYIDVLVNKKGEVGYLYWPFLDIPLKELDIEISCFKKVNIPGHYDVPELGLKDATFIEVLETIRDYFIPRFSSPKPPRAPSENQGEE